MVSSDDHFIKFERWAMNKNNFSRQASKDVKVTYVVKLEKNDGGTMCLEGIWLLNPVVYRTDARVRYICQDSTATDRCYSFLYQITVNKQVARKTLFKPND